MAQSKARIAIIGSGLSGSVLSGLLGRDADVVVYERGPVLPERPPRPAVHGHEVGLYPSFMYGLGGTTNLWHGGMLSMRPDEVGPEWPEPVANDLARYYRDTVNRLYGSEMADAWDRRAESAVGDHAWLTSILYPSQPFLAGASTAFNDSAVLQGAQVNALEESGGSVLVTSTIEGRTRMDSFDYAIVAAGGMGSPLLLRDSGLGGAAAGENYTDHPMGFVAKLAEPRNRALFERLRVPADGPAGSETLKPVLKVRDHASGLWSAFYLRPAAVRSLDSDPYARAFGLLGCTGRMEKYLAALPHMADPDFVYQALESRAGIRMPSNACYVLVINEQEARGQGRVAAGADGQLDLDWTISNTVTGAIGRNLETMAGLLDAELILKAAPLSSRLWSAAHHSGTCRIASLPDDGVVDEDLRVHGASRIFVCDGSVLPSTGCSNTGIAIGALAHRLAGRLRHETAHHVAGGEVALAAKDGLITGAGGQIGKMLRSRLADTPLDWGALSLRGGLKGEDIAPARRVLHLATVRGDVAQNLKLQEKTAAAIEVAGAKEVIVALSFVTFGDIGDDEPDLSSFNAGFISPSPDPYSKGKLAQERFWIDWQQAAPGRKVLFVYIPTICGPQCMWTLQKARHAPGTVLLTPKIERFYTVSEQDLMDLFLGLLESGLDNGVERRIATTSSATLASSVADDRAGEVREVTLPGVLWRLFALASRSVVLSKGLSLVRVIASKALGKLAKRSVIPISADYLHLFRAQSRLGPQIDALMPRCDAAAPPERVLEPAE